MGADLLSIGKSGLFASKKALETTGHNIANVNTEGFTRQKVEQTTSVPLGSGNLVQGSGVRIKGIKRIHDQHIEKRLNINLNQNSFYSEKSKVLSQVEEIFNEVDNDGLHQLIAQFFNSFRELSKRPEDETIRSIVRENAKMVVNDFHRINETLMNLNKQIDGHIERATEEINTQLHKVAELNRRIANIEGVQGESGDLRDQRDLIINELSKQFKLSTYLDDKHQFVVHASGVGSLVSGTHVMKLNTKNVHRDISGNDVEGSTELFLSHRPDFPISLKMKSGTYGALFQARNNEIRQLSERMDELAFHLSNTVNAIHKRGFANKVAEVDPQGRAIASSSDGPLTGILFFKTLDSSDRAAQKLELSNEVRDDLRNIATALAPNQPGDNRVAIAISKIQHEQLLGGGTETLEGHYLESIGRIGLATGKAKLDHEQSEGILAQTRSIKERISGVSLDEEAANMIKFQQAFDASAKVLKTTDEMFKSVLSIMR